jgi:hypothetical protein
VLYQVPGLESSARSRRALGGRWTIMFGERHCDNPREWTWQSELMGAGIERRRGGGGRQRRRVSQQRKENGHARDRMWYGNFSQRGDALTRKGSGTVKIFATTMPQGAQKRAKMGNGRGRDRWVRVRTSRNQPRQHRASVWSPPPPHVQPGGPGPSNDVCAGILSRREVNGLHSECGGVR